MVIQPEITNTHNNHNNIFMYPQKILGYRNKF